MVKLIADRERSGAELEWWTTMWTIMMTTMMENQWSMSSLTEMIESHS